MPDQPLSLRALAWVRRRALGLLLIVAYLWSFPYFEKINNANELPRVWLAQALWDEGRCAVDTGVARLGMKVADLSEVDRPEAPFSRARGRYYSNKAPGMSLLAVPAYALLKLVGKPSLRSTTYWMRLTASTLPQLLFLWLLAAWLAVVCADAVARRVVLVGYALGSLAFTYSVLLMSHQLAAGFAMSSYIVISLVLRGKLRERWLPAAGAAAGLALLCDYQAVFLCVPVAVYLAVCAPGGWRGRLRALALAGAGTLPPLLVLGWYHQVCFGSPFKTGYSASKTFEYLHAQGFLGLRWPPMGRALVGSLLTPDNGLFVLSPLFLLALPGIGKMLRGGASGGQRADGVVALAALVVGVWFVSSIAMWRGGWNLGPRYIAAMLPFLVWPAAEALAWARARWWAWSGGLALVVVSLVVYGVMTPVYPHVPSGQFHPVFVNPLYEVGFELLRRGYAPYSAGRLLGLHGVWGLLPYFVVVAGALVVCLDRKRWRAHGAGVVLGAALIALYSRFPRGRGNHMDCNGNLIGPGDPPCIERVAAKYEPPR